MTNSAVIDGARLLSWARRAAQELEVHREEINSLNVFPVPDSDTGSNMAHTMSAAVTHASSLDADASSAEIASALAVGSVKGARGNSGVVLSQVLRGVAQAAAEGDLDASSVADALGNAVIYVERAISEPVEGTIITVLRSAASAAKQALAAEPAESDHGVESDLHRVSAAAASAAEHALEETPSQLKELREAGVVDAGGKGLVLLLGALRDELANRGGEPESLYAPSATNASAHAGDGSHGHTGWLEIMFMFSGPVDELERVIAPFGTSLVTARVSDSEAKIHIHSRDAGEVIERAFTLGTVTELRLEILPDHGPDSEETIAPRLIVALAPEGHVSELYRQAGAVAVTPGPELVGEITQLISTAGASEVIVLPNGQAEPAELVHLLQAAENAGAQAMVLNTTRLVGGIAAIAVHDPRLPLESAAANMDEAADDMRAADIIRISDRGLTVVSGGEVLAEGSSGQAVVDKACRALLADGGELITLLLEPDLAFELDEDALAETLAAEILVYPAQGVGAAGQIGVE